MVTKDGCHHVPSRGGDPKFEVDNLGNSAFHKEKWHSSLGIMAFSFGYSDINYGLTIKSGYLIKDGAQIKEKDLRHGRFVRHCLAPKISPAFIAYVKKALESSPRFRKSPWQRERGRHLSIGFFVYLAIYCTYCIQDYS
ncbi:hypothetical protein TNIN_128991 [Trichonephila inaurata madagascariensis]|uniref:Uncharacterized protein n=1 Tax=Trichonephila inaurata madagascariensis TaxID=2747483 RepID=A0A8X6XFX4_9ARAC|nr:hypothetical protein TNIN_103631 [Trichonephila inaurata madagascariensis]GFY74331.1 hypothetical protein TNIN_128991 [Trichonephila inaurata madagascariensis]